MPSDENEAWATKRIAQAFHADPDQVMVGKTVGTVLWWFPIALRRTEGSPVTGEITVPLPALTLPALEFRHQINVKVEQMLRTVGVRS